MATAIRKDDRLKGKVAIVTGAGSRAEGIGNGRATAVVLARHGARVTLVDTVAQWAEETKRLIDAEGDVSQIVEGDVGVPASCQAIVAHTAEA
jgi:NAD(P)-dependent dehydrogenase (short-subunit alcohol dehydrogenase family)